ncbi:homoserine O-acetyltransferase [Siculibacillus lacustris]|uniref:Probable acyltransferase n=1 Tax=Siculibacillus lacustris TaxID=1549641 RepID=A0A4Q9VW03_9HYPH|nr:homoserine O-acetyltransferase [Siculibacillus lacustris]TBW40457.1 homoserine O-acetyltransferase [Siculibacillus lacustris]
MQLFAKFAAAALILAATAGAAWSDDLIVEKKTFVLPTYTTAAGAIIKDVRVGWEAYGTLNADKSNAILVNHFFSGTSHAAGKYAADDKFPGYWDAIIGPGKAIDTDKYYVIASDTLVNLNTGSPKTVTTGPATIDPDTGKPYGLRFPVVSIADFVRVEKALVESLGIKKLHAVTGASMGALQTYEWAAANPGMVDRIIPVIGAAEADAFLIAWLDLWADPIRVDPNWAGGDYYGKEPPLAGLAASLKIVSQQASHWEITDEQNGRQWADPARDPAKAIGNEFRVVAALGAGGTARAKVSDANHLLYLVKANQLYAPGGAATLDEAAAKIKAPTLVIYQPKDLVFPGPAVEATIAALKKAGTPVETFQLQGKRGHLDGVVSMTQAADTIRAFLAK